MIHSQDSLQKYLKGYKVDGDRQKLGVLVKNLCLNSFDSWLVTISATDLWSEQIVKDWVKTNSTLARSLQTPSSLFLKGNFAAAVAHDLKRVYKLLHSQILVVTTGKKLGDSELKSSLQLWYNQLDPIERGFTSVECAFNDCPLTLGVTEEERKCSRQWKTAYPKAKAETKTFLHPTDPIQLKYLNNKEAPPGYSFRVFPCCPLVLWNQFSRYRPTPKVTSDTVFSVNGLEAECFVVEFQPNEPKTQFGDDLMKLKRRKRTCTEREDPDLTNNLSAERDSQGTLQGEVNEDVNTLMSQLQGGSLTVHPLVGQPVSFGYQQHLMVHPAVGQPVSFGYQQKSMVHPAVGQPESFGYQQQSMVHPAVGQPESFGYQQQSMVHPSVGQPVSFGYQQHLMVHPVPGQAVSFGYQQQSMVHPAVGQPEIFGNQQASMAHNVPQQCGGGEPQQLQTQDTTGCSTAYQPMTNIHPDFRGTNQHGFQQL